MSLSAFLAASGSTQCDQTAAATSHAAAAGPPAFNLAAAQPRPTVFHTWHCTVRSPSVLYSHGEVPRRSWLRQQLQRAAQDCRPACPRPGRSTAFQLLPHAHMRHLLSRQWRAVGDGGAGSDSSCSPACRQPGSKIAWLLTKERPRCPELVSACCRGRLRAGAGSGSNYSELRSSCRPDCPQPGCSTASPRWQHWQQRFCCSWRALPPCDWSHAW